jgi:hypothetical protein
MSQASAKYNRPAFWAEVVFYLLVNAIYHVVKKLLKAPDRNLDQSSSQVACEQLSVITLARPPKFQDACGSFHTTYNACEEEGNSTSSKVHCCDSFNA